MRPKPSKFNKPKTKKQPQNPEIETTPTPIEFSFTITKVAISQICQSIGFKAAQNSALETLTVVATEYVQQLTTIAASYSNTANRTQSNCFDVINAINDLCINQGFEGASDLQRGSNNCLLSSSAGGGGVLKEISSFVKYTKEIPFAKPIPRTNKNLKLGFCEKNLSSESGFLHIPKWLPDFPDASSYEMVMVCKKRDYLWENSEFVKENYGGVVKNLSGGDLVKERGKVRFKFGVNGGNEVGGGGVGVDMRNGVCRGGKRVCWKSNDKIEDEKNSGFKRRR